MNPYRSLRYEWRTSPPPAAMQRPLVAAAAAVSADTTGAEVGSSYSSVGVVSIRLLAKTAPYPSISTRAEFN